MLDLLKSFAAAAHPRDERGRFSGTMSVAGGSPAPAMIRADGERSLTRGEGWQRTGSKLAAIPPGYTGSAVREMPHGSFSKHVIVHQIPPGMDLKTDAATRKKLFGIVRDQRAGAIEKGTERGLIPEGSDPRTVNRAYAHGAMLGLHDHGAIDYDFKMPPELQADFKPLEGFIRYSRRRTISTVHGEEKGSWRPYRAAFGKPFKDNRRDKVTGAVRLRVRPNDVLIKAAGIQPQGSRWDRTRLALARMENQGKRSFAPLTQPQRLERNTAAKDERIKDASGAPRIQAGATGSIAGQGVSAREGAAPRINLAALARPVRPPTVAQLAKRAHPAAHDMMPDHLKHITRPKRKAPPPPAPVAAMLPTIHAILAVAEAHDPTKDRFAQTQTVADPSASIGQLAR
jgi:hypothetical protein